MHTKPPVQVQNMDAATFFGLFTDNPPQPCDYPILHRLQRVGIHVGQRFDHTTAPSTVQHAFELATADAKALIDTLARKEAGEGRTGWAYTTHSGCYGVDYNYRAAVARLGLSENLPNDAIYPSLTADSDGKPLDGTNKYVLRFDAGKLPPVEGFWSVTAYDQDGYFIPNPLDR